MGLLGFGVPIAERQAARSVELARTSGRSWWALRFIDGRILNEWDHDPGSPTGHMDWPRLAMLGKLRGIQALRLYCPNGRFAEMGGQGDQTGCLFQFKLGVRHVGTGGATIGREVLAHVAGQITGYNGECRLFAWEPEPPPARPDPTGYRGQPPGQLADAYAAWQRQKLAWQACGGGRLVGPLEDNVYRLAYQQVGRLSADHLGIADGEGR